MWLQLNNNFYTIIPTEGKSQANNEIPKWWDIHRRHKIIYLTEKHSMIKREEKHTSIL